MANTLKMSSNKETLRFEKFDLELDDAGKAAFKKDPEGFLRKLISDAGFANNGMMMDLKFLKPETTGGGVASPAPEPQVYHCEAPPHRVSKWITIVL